MNTLFHKGKKDAIYQWSVWTEGADIVTESGQVDGKLQLTRKTATPKNVGRSNATTSEQQALLEAKAMHKKKLDLKYYESIEDAENEVIFLPMLASDFEKRKNKVSYPADVQPKLDGVRCLAYWDGDEVKLMSRGGKQWENCNHIARELEDCLPKGWVLDGELYIHGKTFQEITKLVKKWRPESVDVEFHVYDIPRTEIRNEENLSDWDGRMIDLYKFFGILYEHQSSYIFTVTTYQADTEEDVYKLQSQFLEEGYEGAIVREYDGMYRFGYRSNKLLKVKNFMDEEYEVIDYTTGVGKFDGCVIWICKNTNDDEFKVVPQGTMEHRKELYEDADKYIGEMLKVQFFELTDDGIPRFPVGIGFRLKEDMS